MCADSSEPSLIAKAGSEFLLSQETLSLNKMTAWETEKMLFHYLTGHSFGVSMFCDSEPYRPCK